MHRFRNLTITTKLTWLFSLFAALILVAVGALAYFSGRAAIEQAVTSDLESTANEKQAALDRWLDDRLNLVVSITSFPAYRARVTSLIRDQLDDAARRTLQAQTAQALAGFTGPAGVYTEMMIVEAEQGQVIVSTRPENQGKFNEDRPYFVAGLKGPVIQNFIYSLDERAPLLIVAAPLRADDGRVVAVLAARLKLDEMNDIILRRTGRRHTDDAFLVNTSHLFVTQPRFITDPAVLQRGVHTDPVNRCLAGTSGVLAANDYRGEPVLAVHHWLPERQLCLIVKMDQAEAFAPSNAFGQALAVIALTTLALASLLGLGLARTITVPVRTLQDHVVRFGRGELDVRIPETTGDEVGVLAREFNRMAASLADKDAQLRDYAAGLERRVEERTAALSESEVRFRSLYENSTVGIYRTTPAGRILLANPALVSMLGYASFDELANRDLEQAGFDPAYDRAHFVETIERDGQITGLESGWTRRDGAAIFVRESARAIRDTRGNTLYYDGTVEDITGRKRAEARVKQLNRVYAVLSDVNQTIVRVRDSQALLAAACHIAVEKGGFRLALITRLDELGRRVEVVAHAGINDGYLEQLDIVMDENQPRGRGPTAEALRTGRYILVNDVEHDPRMEPWRESARRERYRSSAAFPLKVGDTVRGALTLYAEEAGFFSDEEIKLLDELAMDISFSLEFAAKEAARQQAEEALRRSEAKYRNLFENAQVGMYRSRLDGSAILAANQRLADILGCTIEDLLAQPALIRWASLSAHAEMIRLIQAQGSVIDYEIAVLTTSGEVRDCLVSVKLYPEEGFLEGTVIDITERKRAEQAVADSQSLLQGFTDNSTSLIYALDPEGRFLLINRRLEAVFGVPRETLIGKTRAAILPTEIAAAHRSNDLTVMNSQEAITVEEENDEPDGKHVYLSVKFPLLNAQGSIWGVGGVSTDITERKRLERERNLLANAIAASVNEVYLFDAETLRFTFVNDGALQNLHYTLAEMQRLTPLDLKPEFTAESFEQLIGPLRRRETPVQVFETVHRRADGSLYPVEVHLQLFEHGDERVFLAIIQDITVRRAAEQEIRQLNAELEQRVLDRTAELEAANKELEAFTYSVSHDLRAPLRAIDGYTRILLEDYAAAFDDEGQHIANIVRDETQRMGRLIDDLLTLSRLSRAAMRLAPIDMQAMVYSIYHQLTTPEARARIDFRVNALPMAEGDAVLIQRAWENLLSNAIKFSARRTQAVIEVSGAVTPPEVIYSVRDNGAGFDIQYARKLFGVFQRLHSDKEFEGTGVGLAIVQRVIHRHGGRVWGEGQVDAGATFYFALPIQRSSND